MGIFRHMTSIPYFFKRQDATVTWATFYGVAGLKILANYWLRSYYIHKVWCEGMDEGLIEYGKCKGTLR